MKVFAVCDDEDVFALFATEDLAAECLAEFKKSEGARWAGAEMPGWRESLHILPVTVFETPEYPVGYIPEWY